MVEEIPEGGAEIDHTPERSSSDGAAPADHDIKSARYIRAITP